jgi:hypothetical protein
LTHSVVYFNAYLAKLIYHLKHETDYGILVFTPEVEAQITYKANSAKEV